MSTNNIVSVTYLLTKLLKIDLTRQSIQSELEKHPEGGTLLAISDVLNRWNIPNAAYNLSYNELLKVEMPLPFLTYLSSGELALVSDIDEDKLRQRY